MSTDTKDTNSVANPATTALPAGSPEAVAPDANVTLLRAAWDESQVVLGKIQAKRADTSLQLRVAAERIDAEIAALQQQKLDIMAKEAPIMSAYEVLEAAEAAKKQVLEKAAAELQAKSTTAPPKPTA